jgi:transcriptional regulator with XRE-family HTH domain
MTSTEAAPTAETDLAGQSQVHEIVSLIGPKLHALRSARGHSLQQLAVLSDVSAAAIHKIERNGMVPTITTLLKLGAALGVPVSYFVEEDEPPPEPVHHTPADRRPTVYTPHEGLALAGITGSYRQFQTAAAVATVAPGASSGDKLLVHPGEELVHVVEGVLTFRVGDHTYPLHPGDSLHFGGQVPHHWANETGSPARAIWIALRNG